MNLAGQALIRILIVSQDEPTVETLIDRLESRFECEITQTDAVAEALRRQRAEPYDVIISELHLHDGGGLNLAREVNAETKSSVILMTDRPAVDSAIEAMRTGVMDLLVKPVESKRLIESVSNAVRAAYIVQRQQRRIRRLRKIVHKTVHERRQLRQRIDLLCTDLVGAYQELVDKVVHHIPESHV